MQQEKLVNESIESNFVIVIDDRGVFLGEMNIAEALGRAIDKNMDLVQITDEEVPVCKIVDSGKFFYEQTKKQKNSAQRPKTKEVKFRPSTEEHDYQTKLRSIKKFIGKKNRVKISIVFRGREASHEEIGYDLANRILDDMGVDPRPMVTMENNTITFVLGG